MTDVNNGDIRKKDLNSLFTTTTTEKQYSMPTPPPVSTFNVSKIPEKTLNIFPMSNLEYNHDDKGYMMIMDKKQFDTMQIFYIVLIVIFGIIAISFLIWFFIDGMNTPEPPPKLETYKPLQSSKPQIQEISKIKNLTYLECQGSNLKWNGQYCECAFPFYGPYCLEEFFDPNFIDFGPADLQKLNFTSEEYCDATSLSYLSDGSIDPTSCTTKCLENENCIGALYQLCDDVYRCSLITSSIEVNVSNPINKLAEYNGNIYLKKGNYPILNDQVVVYSGDKPVKYWDYGIENIPTLSNKNGFKNILKSEVVKLTWTPTKIINSSGMIGIWSTQPFNPSDFNSLLNSQNVYVDSGMKIGEYSLNLPPQFAGQNLYVMYRKK